MNSKQDFGRPEHAITYFKHANKLDPTNPEIWGYITLSYLKEGSLS